MRLLVTGGRTFRDFRTLAETLDALHAKTPVSLLIHGAAPGTDSLAAAWAAFRHVPAQAYPADWTTHGKAAGPIRNQQMLTEGRPDAYLAFPGGKGTADMVARCKKANVPDAQAPKNPPSIFNPETIA